MMILKVVLIKKYAIVYQKAYAIVYSAILSSLVVLLTFLNQ